MNDRRQKSTAMRRIRDRAQQHLTPEQRTLELEIRQRKEIVAELQIDAANQDLTSQYYYERRSQSVQTKNIELALDRIRDLEQMQADNIDIGELEAAVSDFLNEYSTTLEYCRQQLEQRFHETKAPESNDVYDRRLVVDGSFEQGKKR